MERFWRTLKEEVLEKEWFKSLEEAQVVRNYQVNAF
ncbi:integrase core domain-containing protein [Neomoorella mulderi]